MNKANRFLFHFAAAATGLLIALGFFYGCIPQRSPFVAPLLVLNSALQAKAAATQVGTAIIKGAELGQAIQTDVRQAEPLTTQPDVKTILIHADGLLIQQTAAFYAMKTSNDTAYSTVMEMAQEHDELQGQLTDAQAMIGAQSETITKQAAELKSQHMTAMSVALALMIGVGGALVAMSLWTSGKPSVLGICMAIGGTAGLIIINFVHAANDWVNAHIGWILGGIAVALIVAAAEWWKRHQGNVNLKIANAVTDTKAGNLESGIAGTMGKP